MQNLLTRGSKGNDVQLLKQALVKQLGADAAAFGSLAAGDELDADTEAAMRRWQAGVGLVADGVMGPYCQTVLGLRSEGPLSLSLRQGVVRQLFPATKPANIARYWPYVAAALDALGLVDRLMVCAALGTIRAETEGFLPIAEFQSQYNTRPGGAPFGAYSEPGNKLGNMTAADGVLFKGRGFVQLTGRYNYATYGALIGLDLTSKADLALAPEVAALLLAHFLVKHAEFMRAALAQAQFSKARRKVNGGTHGLDRFTDVFRLADTVWPEPKAVTEVAVKGGGRTATRAEAAASPVAKRSLTVRKDPKDINDRPYLPPPVGLQEAFPSDKDIAKFLPAYSQAGMILNQGQEGACTGFGLACVVNYLRWAKADYPEKMDSVSPRMFYNFARRYDEYAGEDYDGSSCRGALKGWFNNGVCMESDWPFSDTNTLQPKYGYAERAANNTLGVYYRIELASITDMQAAIQSTGAVYVSAYTHSGWENVRKNTHPPANHAELPEIAFDGKPSKMDGHAFALVGFNARGFIVQNSWGWAFGAGGFAVLTYADWLTNAMDAWVVGMGVPGVVSGRVSVHSKGAIAAKGVAGAADTSAWWSTDKAYQHSVVLGNDGRVRRYLTEDELSRTLLHQVAGLPDQWFRSQPADSVKRLVIIVHGGLNSEDDAIKRARAMGRHFLGNGCYPLFLVWKTGLLESIGNIAADAFRRQPVLAGGVGEWFSEKTDLLIESSIGRPLARPIWSEMKENAELAFGEGRGGQLLITALQKLTDTWGDKLEVHVVGHSAGSIILGHLLSALQTRRLVGKVKSTHLFAPACTVQFANKHYAPQTEVMKSMYMHVLANNVERDDNVAMIYRKSLLYFVSNALESDLRTPILGLENVTQADYSGWDGSSSTGEALKAWRQAAASAGLNKADRYNVITSNKVTTARSNTTVNSGVQIDAAHGSFDNDVDVITKTLERIRGGKLLVAVDDLRGF